MANTEIESTERPATVSEAFVQTAKALQQFGIERVRITGLCAPNSLNSDESNTNYKNINNNNDNNNNSSNNSNEVRTITEHEFMREFVFHSRPCIIVDALYDWPAMQRWRSDTYLFNLDGHLPKETPETLKPSSSSSSSYSLCDAETRDDVMNNGTNEKKVTVALTPNGRADAVTYVTFAEPGGEADNTTTTETTTETKMTETKTEIRIKTQKLFMCAAEEKVTLPQLYTLLSANPLQPPPRSQHVDLSRCGKNSSSSSSVCFTSTSSTATPLIAYAQLQNNCLATEYRHLHSDIRTELDAFGERVFGFPHEAANMWLGTPASVSSMHQDWVENLYAVVRGVKEFILIPPWEGVFVPKPEIPSAAYAVHRRSMTTTNNTEATGKEEEKEEEKEHQKNSEEPSAMFTLDAAPVYDGLTVPWMDLEFAAAAVDNNELLPPNVRGKLRPLVAYVHPGEVLYLPSMWLHRVAQHADAADCAERENGAQTATGKKTATETKMPPPPLPLIAAVNYWYDMSFTNPAVVMLREFGLLL